MAEHAAHPKESKGEGGGNAFLEGAKEMISPLGIESLATELTDNFAVPALVENSFEVLEAIPISMGAPVGKGKGGHGPKGSHGKTEHPH